MRNDQNCVGTRKKLALIYDDKPSIQESFANETPCQTKKDKNASQGSLTVISQFDYIAFDSYEKCLLEMQKNKKTQKIVFTENKWTKFKGPYSFEGMIVKALLSSMQKQMTSAEIFEYLEKEKMFFDGEKRKMYVDRITRSLNSHEYFVVKNRSAKGNKGFIWSLDPAFEFAFENNLDLNNTDMRQTTASTCFEPETFLPVQKDLNINKPDRRSKSVNSVFNLEKFSPIQNLGSIKMSQKASAKRLKKDPVVHVIQSKANEHVLKYSSKENTTMQITPPERQETQDLIKSETAKNENNLLKSLSKLRFHYNNDKDYESVRTNSNEFWKNSANYKQFSKYLDFDD